MIKIRKPKKVPDKLKTTGAAKRKVCCDDYLKAPAKYDSGALKFDFDSGIYAHASVKDALIVAQHGKCCFCESKITPIAYGDVEHFRPKKGFQQKRSDTLGRPGYYWLAYTWSNLFLSCQLCNQRHKKNLFPLADPAQRARNHTNDLAAEEPLFVDPGLDNPEEHITFESELALPRDGSERGRITIKELGLNRPELQAIRHDHYVLMKTLHAVTVRWPDTEEAQQAQALLDRRTADEAQYASMVRCAVGDRFA